MVRRNPWPLFVPLCVFGVCSQLVSGVFGRCDVESLISPNPPVNWTRVLEALAAPPPTATSNSSAPPRSTVASDPRRPQCSLPCITTLLETLVDPLGLVHPKHRLMWEYSGKNARISVDAIARAKGDPEALMCAIIHDPGDFYRCQSLSSAHHCTVLVLGVEVGLCIPQVCSPDDLRCIASSVVHDHLPPDWVDGSEEEPDTLRDRILSAVFVPRCGDNRHELTTGSISVFLVSLSLAVLSVLATGHFLLRRKRARRQQQQQRQERPHRASFSPDMSHLHGSSALAGGIGLPRYLWKKVVHAVRHPKAFGALKERLLHAPSSLSSSSSSAAEASSKRDSLESSGSIAPLIADDAPLKGWSAVLRCFSLPKNFDALVHVGTAASDHRTESLDGMRVLSMMWIVLGHTTGYASEVPFQNPFHFIATFKELWFQGVTAGLMAVDTFLWLSGLLGAYSLMKHLDKAHGPAWKHVSMAYVLRYIRVAPLYLMAVVWWWFVFDNAGWGPRWAQHPVSTTCDRVWWYHPLMIINWSNMEGLLNCIGWGWYLAVDFQLFLVLPFVVLLYRRSKPAGLAAAGVVLLGCVVASWVITEQYDFGISTFVVSKTGRNFDFFDFFTMYYVKPYTRGAPWAVGVLAGFLLYEWDVRHKEPIWNQTRVLTALVTGMACLSVVVFTPYDAVREFGIRSTWTTTGNAAWNALHKPLWGIGLTLVFLAIREDRSPDIRMVGQLMGLPLWQILSRLTFGAYLFHPFLVIGYFRSLVSLHIWSMWRFIVLSLGFIVASYFVSAIAWLLVEKPLTNLIALAFERTRPAAARGSDSGDTKGVDKGATEDEAALASIEPSIHDDDRAYAAMDDASRLARSSSGSALVSPPGSSIALSVASPSVN